MKTAMAMRMMAAGVLLMLGTGCLKVKDDLTIQADGSGTVKMEVVSAIPGELGEGNPFNQMGMGVGNGAVTYPPLNQSMTDMLFPADSFTVTTKSSMEANGGKSTFTVEAKFKDIDHLLNSPYAKAHSLWLKRDGTKLQFKALSGLQLFAAMSENKEAMNQMAGQPMGMKPEELYMEFRVTLPGAIMDSNGQKTGNTSVWVVDRSKIKDGQEAIKQLGTVMEAGATVEGLAFTPDSPTRLQLGKFQDVKEGVTGNKTQAPDTNQVLAAVHFVPQTLQTMRTIDLSGEGGAGNETANLQGILKIKHALAPGRVREVQVTEVKDSSGKDLKMAKPDNHNGGDMDEEEMGNQQNYVQPMAAEQDDETDETAGGGAAKKVGEDWYSVTLNFKAPEWKSKEVAALKGSIVLDYFGGSQLVKVEKAIPKIASMEAMDFEPVPKLSNPMLTELGMTIIPQQAMYQQGMAQVGLQVRGKQGIQEIQAFDADGNPCPGVYLNEGNETQLILIGKPKAPLSLAVVISRNAATVTVPIQLEHIPLMNAAK